MTVTDVTRRRRRSSERRKNAPLRGGDPRATAAGRSSSTATASAADRAAALDGDGRTRSSRGGTDIDPARYGRPNTAATDIEPERDALEAEAWATAAERGLPVLGICRGFQAINVFSGGTLLQHVAAHAGTGLGQRARADALAPARSGSRLPQPSSARASPGLVNTYHHQARHCRPTSRPGCARPPGPPAQRAISSRRFELPGERFLVGVQCHPERTEFSPPERSSGCGRRSSRPSRGARTLIADAGRGYRAARSIRNGKT